MAAVGQPDVEHRVLDRVEAGAIGKHPTAEDPPLFVVEHDLVDLDEARRLRRLGRRAGIADARGDFEGAEGRRLVERNLEPRNLGGHLVEGGKHRDRVVDALGQGPPCGAGAQRGRAGTRQHPSRRRATPPVLCSYHGKRALLVAPECRQIKAPA
jgi:hypothetical protein